MSDYRGYPTQDITTKYGTLTLTFLDATEVKEQKWQQDRHVAVLGGNLTIRGVGVSISTRLYYAERDYRDGVQLPKPITVLDMDYRNTYNRRKSGPGSLTEQVTPGASRVIRELVEGIVRETYEANPGLQREATSVRLFNAMIDAERKRDEAYEAYEAAEKAFAVAKAALR